MKIIRFVDTLSQVQFGIPEANSRARLISGDLFDPGEPLEESRDVAAVLSPVSPNNVFCIGLNYRAHAKESGMELPKNPPLFMKPTSTVTHPDSVIMIPAACERGPEVDYEAELCVIIGREARNVSVESALEYAAGYTCANDVSARKWQMHGGGGQWVRGKSFDTFCPLGPLMVTADEVPDPQSLNVRCRVNGTTLQNGHTSDMIFSVAEIIAYLSRDTTLLPGSVILTGTPPGVGFARKPPIYLQDGDTVEVEIEGIGTLRNPVRNA